MWNYLIPHWMCLHDSGLTISLPCVCWYPVIFIINEVFIFVTIYDSPMYVDCTFIAKAKVLVTISQESWSEFFLSIICTLFFSLCMFTGTHRHIKVSLLHSHAFCTPKIVVILCLMHDSLTLQLYTEFFYTHYLLVCVVLCYALTYTLIKVWGNIR